MSTSEISDVVDYSSIAWDLTSILFRVGEGGASRLTPSHLILHNRDISVSYGTRWPDK